MALQSSDTSGRQVSALDEVKLANSALKNVLTESSATDAAFGVALRSAVRTLADALKHHEELAEAPGGHLEFIVTEKPALVPMADRQQAEHLDMGARATHIEHMVAEELAFDQLDVDLLRLETQVLCDIVELHIARATSLMYETLYTVEGGEQG